VEVLITEDAPSPPTRSASGLGEGGITPVGAVIAAAIDEAIGV